jgi:hypothetical protein
LEDFVAQKCKWNEPRWLTWQRWQYEFEHAPRNLHIPFTSSFITLRRQKRFVGKRFKNSTELKELFSLAEKISPHRADFQGRSLPLLNDEIMLLAAIRSEHPIGRALVESGLDTGKLEEPPCVRSKIQRTSDSDSLLKNLLSPNDRRSKRVIACLRQPSIHSR